MTRIQNFIAALSQNRRGQDLIEYALLAGFVASCAASCFPAIMAVGTRLDQVMATLLDNINRLGG